MGNFGEIKRIIKGLEKLNDENVKKYIDDLIDKLKEAG